MRSVVALLKARPETINNDYRRLLGLAGLNFPSDPETILMALEARQPSWVPGLVCPPWQVAGVLDSLKSSETDSSSKASMVPVSDTGPQPGKTGLHFGWEDVLLKESMTTMDSSDLEAVSYRSEGVIPSLEGTLPDGLKFSPHFRGKNLFILSSLGLKSGGNLKSGLALLNSLLVAERKPKANIPEAEIMAEVVGLAREVFSSLSVITDATIWSVTRRGGSTVPLVRNLLVAGNDPVAVDSVIGHLAGKSLAEMPWLGLCESRGLGVADLAKIRIVGEPECMDLDFRIPEDTFASGNAVLGLSADALGSRLMRRSSGVRNLPADSAWSKLFRDYQSGVTS